MAIAQDAFFIPDDIATGLATGLYRRIGSVVRYAINTRNYAYGGIIPHTGDGSNLRLWMALGGISLLAIAGGGIYLRARSRKRETDKKCRRA